jgi:hypothetical protein
MTRRFARFVQGFAAVRLGRFVVPVLFVTVFLLAAGSDPVDGFFVALALVVLGGLGMVVALVLAHLRPTTARVRDDLASEMHTSDVINMSHIRVAGVGGFGLVVVALAIALEFDLAGIALLSGLVGGAVGAGLLIALRRHGPVDSSSQGPSARVFLTVDGGLRRRRARDDDRGATVRATDLSPASSSAR